MSPLLLLCATAPAAAQDMIPSVMVAAEFGALTNRDAAYDLFSSRNTMRSFGARVGYRLFPGVEVVASWHRSRRGLQMSVPPSETALTFEDGSGTVATALTTDQIALGPRIDTVIRDIFLPYATVQATALVGSAQLDDDVSDRNNANQIRYGGVGVGVQAFAGAEISVETGVPVRVSFFGELGYATPMRVPLGDLGQIRPGGLTGNLGAGLRF